MQVLQACLPNADGDINIPNELHQFQTKIVISANNHVGYRCQYGYRVLSGE